MRAFIDANCDDGCMIMHSLMKDFGEWNALIGQNLINPLLNPHISVAVSSIQRNIFEAHKIKEIIVV
jgi:hypothetical protein